MHELITADSVICDLQETSRTGAIRELVEKLAAAGRISSDSVDGIAKSIVARERSRGSTGFGKGVAIPHTKLPELTRVVAAIGRSSKGIDFSALDGAPVFAVILILSPEEDAAAHLKAMDVVFSTLQQERFRKFLRNSDTVEKIVELLKDAEDLAKVG
ncbi:MAG: PTS sugar transporter subunit IIA [Phycisphaerae bacterium]|nr:PTS sugar transporter subunit IIA [Phycisphaerae bacterium]